MGMIVKVGEAKTRLSELLARVEAGEEIVISHSDHPVARLLPMQKRQDVEGAIADILAARSVLSTTAPDEIIAWRGEGRR
ncbi:type II toxin-antitoxin system prevent-host-death family antitoxin [uncultured Jannaschia sp.]|uniref:type II toxin-antitoxin system Phd/YefM family antitoxin n=1 Tax=uncultured Jannaschia sp. TaxID=293347 RepID=UPI00262A31EF|nr:type II toxin-antitoxin system prevent-host-death family antitoxin [uncultured Jannaschia sp.]